MSFIKDVLNLIETDFVTKSLKVIATEAFKHKAKKTYLELNDKFEELSKHEIPDIVKVALLRHTFSVKQHIPFWNDYLLVTEESLIKNNRCPREYLYGLKQF